MRIDPDYSGADSAPLLCTPRCHVSSVNYPEWAEIWHVPASSLVNHPNRGCISAAHGTNRSLLWKFEPTLISGPERSAAALNMRSLKPCGETQSKILGDVAISRSDVLGCRPGCLPDVGDLRRLWRVLGVLFRVVVALSVWLNLRLCVVRWVIFRSSRWNQVCV